MRPPATLALEDGQVFTGVGFGAVGTRAGEICFNTAMTGYQEVLTDPSYHGQIVTMTAPQIGNTGVNDHDDQSSKPWVAGFVAREVSPTYSSWRATRSLQAYLESHGVVGVSEIDTRKLTRHIRTAGAMRAVLSTDTTDGDELVDMARSSPSLVGRDLVAEVTTAQAYEWGPEQLEARATSGYAAGRERSPASRKLLEEAEGQGAVRIAAFDYGMKRNILDLLVASGCEVTVLPATAGASEVLDAGFDGVFLSNGPGDPEPVSYGIETVRRLLGRVPIFGICLGHQILALALEARTFKLPFGHRGGNHPVKKLGCARVEITCQNHGFAVVQDSLADTQANLTHVNLNDHTVEGLEVPGVAYSVQYHPEAGPGPHDSRYLFGQFRRLIATFENQDVQPSRRLEGV